MKTLLSSTALVIALGLPTLTLAQTTDTTATSETQRQGGQGSGFLSKRGQSDLYASELMGHDVYARRSAGENNGSTDQMSNQSGNMNGMMTMNRSDMDSMDNIGQINEVVLSHDGRVQALVIGVGGFLGMGEHDVAVTMDQITFASDADDQSETYIVMNAGSDLLENAPAYDRTMTRADAATGSGEGNRPQARETAANDETDMAPTDEERTEEERSAFMAPEMEREGYNRVEARDVSTEMLIDRTVYDVNDNDVGEVQDMIINDAGEITNVIIDFGGFLGIGSSQASLSFDELTVMSDEGYADVRLYVDATKEQIQDLPRYMASN